MAINYASNNLREQIEHQTQAVASHYDLPPSFFSEFLGPWMAYSCAYFTHPDNTLQQAEEDKLHLVSKKLQLSKDNYVLDIGCGWGSFIFYATEHYGCKTHGITLSSEQADFVNREAKRRGLSDRVSAQVMHVYDMEFSKEFDKIVTVGAIEHMDDLTMVFNKSASALKDSGLILVHGMTKPWKDREYELNGNTSEVGEMVKEHFGVGYWHSLWELIESLERNDFEVLDHENITRHYQLTVERWLENLQERESSIAGKILPEEKFREFVVFMAGYIVGFETGHTLCNQVLCRKIICDDIRPKLPLTRQDIILSHQEV